MPDLSLAASEQLSDPPERPSLPRVLLLNPPGDDAFLRDYYCSKTSKSSYLYTPVDLLIVGAHLKPHAELQVVDAIASKLSRRAVIRRIQEFRPDLVVMLMAAVSWRSDLRFLKELKRVHPGRVLGSGDILIEDPARTLRETPELDAILTDFSTSEVIDYAVGGTVLLRDIVSRAALAPEHAQTRHSYDIPVPPHELFPNDRYRYPFVRRLLFATVLTDFGCPFSCTYCIQGTLGYKSRSAENVLRELRALKAMGFKDLYFSDQTFAFDPARARAMFQSMIKEDLQFGWVAFYRADLVRPEMLELMKKAGCHTLIFGVESANESMLKNYGRSLKIEQARKAIELCRSQGIRTVGTFILGFPEESAEDVEATIRLSLELGLDFASYNLPAPRSRTAFRREAMADGLLPTKSLSEDQSGKYPGMRTRHLSTAQLFKLRNAAIRRFYLRPSYLARRMAAIRTWTDLKISALDGIALIRESLRRKQQT